MASLVVFTTGKLQDSSDIPVSKLGQLNMAEEKNTAVLKSNIYLTDI